MGQRYPFDDRRKPTNADCWQSSYRWHMDHHEDWVGKGNRRLMLALVEDGQLGPGQCTEKKMAEAMGCTRLEVQVKRLQIGELGGAELDNALLKVAWLL